MKTVSNWSGSVKFKPAQIAKPVSEAEIQRLVEECGHQGRVLRTVGSGHSFSSLIETNGCLLSLDRLQGLVSLDPASGVAELFGGTKLWAMNDLLFEKGRCLENLGDINRQSIAGTVSTGTHGTGAKFGSVSTQLEEITLVTADGSLRTIGADSELFKAAQVSLGAFGVITRVKLRTLPAYKLKLIQEKDTLDHCLANLSQSREQNRHFEFFYFPYTRSVQSKYVNETLEQVIPKSVGTVFNDLVMENLAFKILSEISRWVPGSTRAIARLCGAAVSGAKKIDWAHRVFSMPRLVKFQEMEFSVPRDSMADVLTELSQMIEKKKIRVHFPIECRYVKGDDIWLSPAHGRDSAYLAIHSYKGMEYREYFEAAQSIFRNHQGRPHWGKMHFLKARDLKPLYPKFENFLEVREKLDPRGTFLNQTLKNLFYDI
jgi:FAD-linked oxidoreductase